MADAFRVMWRENRRRCEPQLPPLTPLEQGRLAAALGSIVLGAWELRGKRRRHRARPAKDAPPNLGEHVV